MITFFIKLATLVLLRMRSPKPLKSNPPTENWYHSRHSCDVVLPVDLPVTNLLIPVRLVVSSKRLCAVIIGNWSESDGGTHTVLQTHIALVPAEEAWGSFRNIRELKTNKINNHSQLLSKPQKVGVMPGPSRTSWSLPMTRPRSGARPCFATSGLCRVIRSDDEQMKH